MNHLIKTYENYKEEERLTTNNSRKIEYITNIRAIKEVIGTSSKILDCGAGTGEYAIELGRLGHDVTAVDITPRHVKIMDERIKNERIINKNISISAGLGDATNLNQFGDESFNIVLCMGPYYHLPEKELRDKCIKECKRVLKKGGLLVLAYIGRFFVCDLLFLCEGEEHNNDLINTLREKGEMRHGDEGCFWTDCYFANPEEIENELSTYEFKVIDHLASDGITPLMSKKVDLFSEKVFQDWCEYHYKTCREKSLLGASNHGLIIVQK